MAPYREPANITSGCGAGDAAAEGEVAIVASVLGGVAAGAAADPQAPTSKPAIANTAIGGARWLNPARLAGGHPPPLHRRLQLALARVRQEREDLRPLICRFWNQGLSRRGRGAAPNHPGRKPGCADPARRGVRHRCSPCRDAAVVRGRGRGPESRYARRRTNTVTRHSPP